MSHLHWTKIWWVLSITRTRLRQRHENSIARKVHWYFQLVSRTHFSFRGRRKSKFSIRPFSSYTIHVQTEFEIIPKGYFIFWLRFFHRFQDPITVGSRDPNISGDSPVSTVSAVGLRGFQKGHEDAGINAASDALLLLALPPLSKSWNDR